MTARPTSGGSGALRLAPASRIPLRDQIAVQVAAGVRAGEYGPGDRLPSARRLSRRLSVHRDTVRAAYRRLAGRGLVTIRPGSGVYVTEPTEDGFRGFLARERAAGRTFDEVARLMERWRRAVSARRVTLVGPDAGLREVWAAELRPALDPIGVRTSNLSPAEALEDPGRLATSIVAGPAGALGALERALPRWAGTVRLRSGPSPRLRRLLLRLPRGAVLVLVTRSDALARQARELTASLRDGEVALRAGEPDAGPRLERPLRVARFVLTDMSCRPEVRGRVGRRRLLTIRQLPPETGRELARCFGPVPSNGDPDG